MMTATSTSRLDSTVDVRSSTEASPGGGGGDAMAAASAAARL
jgi:hypothetical protein